LLLQPIVENAIRYGIGHGTASGHVAVSAQRRASQLVLRVRDNGPGLPDEWHASGCGGVGLTNTQERLQQMYGPLHEFVLGNAAGGGADVTITIPLQLADDGVASASSDRLVAASAHA